MWVFALWMSLVGTALAGEPEEVVCATPQSAADSLFAWQTEGAAQATVCAEVPPGREGSLGRLAVQLNQVLDARGLYMPVSTLPDEPDVRDDDGQEVVVPLEQLPVVTLVRGKDGLWRYSATTMEAVPSLYAQTFSPLSMWFQSSLPSVFYVRFLGLFLWQYLYAALLLLAAYAAGQLARLLLKGRVKALIERSKLPFDEATYARTNFPIMLLVALGVVYWGLTDLQLGIRTSYALHQIVWVALWLAGVLAVSRFIDVGAEVAKAWSANTDSKLDDQAIPLLRQAAQIVVFVFGLIYVADAAGIDVWQLAAGVSIGGLAFALAAQDTVANVFGSVNIFVDRPFQIGDWVKMCGVEGVVEEVGFRSTRVRTFYNSLVTIPNSQITNANVDNFGLRPRRRIKMTLGLTYDTPPDKVEAYVEGIRAILAAHPFVQRTYEVHLYNLGSSAIEILVYYHVVTPGWHEELVARSQNIQEFMRLADDLGVSFAFPSTSVYLESTPEHPLPEHPTPPIEELQATYNAYGPDGARARPLGTPFTNSWTVQARGVETKGNADDG
jgi:MscS family membrane protein